MKQVIFSLEFTSDNDAFQDDPALEASLILRRVSTAVANGVSFDDSIRDTLGNTIGRAILLIEDC